MELPQTWVNFENAVCLRRIKPFPCSTAGCQEKRSCEEEYKGCWWATESFDVHFPMLAADSWVSLSVLIIYDTAVETAMADGEIGFRVESP
jgi:hypothetical protein